MDPRKFNKRLKSILTKRTRLTPDDAETAIATCLEEGKPFAEVLARENFISEKETISAISQEMNLPPIDVSKVIVGDDILESITQDVASYYCILPISKLGKLLTVAVADPFDILKLDDLKLVTGCEIRPVISTEPAIREAIQTSYDRSSEAMSQFIDGIVEPDVDMEITGTDEDDETIDMASLTGEKGHPIIRLVNMIIYQAIRDKASDIHIEPFEKKIRIRYRVDGTLKETTSPPKRMHNSIISRIKIMCGLDIAEKRRPQDGKFQLRVENRQIDFRVSTLPMVHGEKVVLRILDSSNLAMKLESLGFEPETLKAIRDAIGSPYGMVLVTGPTGSGKSKHTEAGPGHRDDRGDTRPRDRGDSREGGAHRPPRPFDTAHERRSGHYHAHDRHGCGPVPRGKLGYSYRRPAPRPAAVQQL
jgi:type IV pilus assembly protein PilB